MNNLSKLIFKFLKSYGVRITNRTIEQTIFKHPEYPSMQCISDAFDSWRIKNIVAKVSIEAIREMRAPTIAHLKRVDV